MSLILRYTIEENYPGQEDSNESELFVLVYTDAIFRQVPLYGKESDIDFSWIKKIYKAGHKLDNSSFNKELEEVIPDNIEPLHKNIMKFKRKAIAENLKKVLSDY